MAYQPPHPANLSTPPASSSQPSVAFTPRSSSIADDSDEEFEPTPLQSPRGGPDYDDLPPSYNEAQHQAVSDARQGVAPLDPSQIEAHRLTLNEGPNEPEVWEYRVRGEELNEAEEHEQAPEYENLGTHVPVQYVQNSDSIPVGRTGIRDSASTTAPISAANLLNRALEFTRHQPDTDVKYAPRLLKRIGVPSNHDKDVIPAQFLRGYAKALHAHSIRPAEFVEFLDGLNALCVASNASIDDLVYGDPNGDSPVSIVQDYITGANEGFFAPRGLRVSLRSLSTLVAALDIPTRRGQRDGAVASVLDHTAIAEKKARALHPWIEALETDVPAQSTQSLVLFEMAERSKAQRSVGNATGAAEPSMPGPVYEHEDPPHSVPEPVTEHEHARSHDNRRHGRGRGGHRSGPWSPFGAPGHGPYGAPGMGPFGPPGNGPFGAPGHGPYGASGNGPFGRPGNGPFGRPGRGPFGGRGCSRSGQMGSGGANRSSSSQPGNEWAALGQDLGKWGEEFGKRMGDLGQQFGKQAETWGRGVGGQAEAWGQNVERRAEANRATASGSARRAVAAPTQADDTLPPSYAEGSRGQESSVLRSDSKDATGPPKYDDLLHDKKSVNVEKDDDASSLSSDSSDSDSNPDSDSDDSDDLPDAQAVFLKRVQSINRHAEEAALKGKKSPDEIAHERDAAIEKAQNEKIATELKVEGKLSKRTIRREHLQKRRDLKREHRHKKRALRAAYVGKGKGKAKKTPEWKQAKKEYREKKKELRKEGLRARKEWRDSRTARLSSRGSGINVVDDQQEAMKGVVWVVVENLHS